MDLNKFHKEFRADQTVDVMKELGIDPPGAIAFPFTIKLNEKYAATFDRKGLELEGNSYVEHFTCTVTRNNVVLMEKE